MQRYNFLFLVSFILLMMAGVSFIVKNLTQSSVKSTDTGLTTNSATHSPQLDNKSLFQPLEKSAYRTQPAINEGSITSNTRQNARTVNPVDKSPEPITEDKSLFPTEIFGGNPPIDQSNLALKQGKQKHQNKTEFYKIDFDGIPLSESAQRWSCARDKKTGLLWETKLFDAGVSDVEHRYSWYSPNSHTSGFKNGGHCFGIECDTYAYVVEMNRLGLCGSKAWRLPTFVELQTILDRDYFNPVINQEIFHYTSAASYWTQTQLENNPKMAMQIDFFNGTSSPAPIHFKLAVRLVSD